jgi:hypothetical protein
MGTQNAGRLAVVQYSRARFNYEMELDAFQLHIKN